MWFRTIVIGLSCLLSACASYRVAETAECDVGPVRLLTDFDQARASDCQRLGPASFAVTVAPEATPINPSSWYAFDLVSNTSRKIRVRLNYADAGHRYHPKLSTDLKTWARLVEDDVAVSDDRSTATLTIPVQRGRSRVAGQDVLSPSERLDWVDDFARRADLDVVTIGSTVEGRPIMAMRAGLQSTDAPLIILLGGQHPPEVPGVFGMRAFLETLFFSGEASRAFLDSHSVLIVPEMNLDGIARGHWRLNSGLVDLNRDWGPFTQAETVAVANEIARLSSAGQRPALMLDFHATRQNIFYTPEDDAGLEPPNFTSAWLGQIEDAWPGEMPARSASHNPGLPTSRSWFVKTYNAPALTVEFGDETSRRDINALAELYATALMDLGALDATQERQP